MLIHGRRPKQLMQQIGGWLFPYWLGPNRICLYCHGEFDKAQGYHDAGRGWFCDKDHYLEYMDRNAL